MDNRTALTRLGLSQLAWGRLCGVNPRTAQRWFEEGAQMPVLVHRLLVFFADHPRIFKTFMKAVDDEN